MVMMICRTKLQTALDRDLDELKRNQEEGKSSKHDFQEDGHIDSDPVASLLLTSEKAVFCNCHYHLHRHHLYNPHLTSAPSKQHPPPPTASGLATRKGGTWRLLCNNIIIILTIITTTMIIKIIAIRKRRTRLRICKCYTMIQKQPDF